MKPVATYKTIEDFYDERGGRFSGECRFGVFNTNDLEDYGGNVPRGSGVAATSRFGMPLVAFSPAQAGRFVVAAVYDTGDVYALNEAASDNPVALLGTLEMPEGADHYREWSGVFEGYAHTPTLGRSLSWFMQRIEEARR